MISASPNLSWQMGTKSPGTPLSDHTWLATMSPFYRLKLRLFCSVSGKASVLWPRGVTTCVSPLSSEQQVLMFHTKACPEFMPPLCRLPHSPFPAHVCARPGKTLISQFRQHFYISTLHRRFTSVHLFSRNLKKLTPWARRLQRYPSLPV